MRGYIGMELKQGYVMNMILYMNCAHISAVLGLPFKQAVISNAASSFMLAVFIFTSPYAM